MPKHAKEDCLRANRTHPLINLSDGFWYRTIKLLYVYKSVSGQTIHVHYLLTPTKGARLSRAVLTCSEAAFNLR